MDVAKSNQDFAREMWDELFKLRQKHLELGIKYLFLTNSGGSVSYLAFLGSSSEMRDVSLNFYALACFVFALILVGVYQAFQFQASDYLFESFAREARPVFRSEFNLDSYSRLLGNNDERIDKLSKNWFNYCSYISAYGSFVLFIAGCGCAGVGLIFR